MSFEIIYEMPNLYRTGPPAAAAGERQQELEPRPEHGRHRGTQTGVWIVGGQIARSLDLRA